MTVPPDIRTNFQIPFPSQVSGAAPVTVAKKNGIYTVGFNLPALGTTAPTPPSYATDFILVYDSIAQTYSKVSLSTFSGLLSFDNTTAFTTPGTSASRSLDTRYGPQSLVVNVMDFGAVADNSTDNLTAFNAALSYLIANTVSPYNSPPFYGPVASLYIPAGKYFFSGPLNIHIPVHIRGAGYGAGQKAGTVLRFAADQWGLVLHEYRTKDDGTGNASTSAGLGDATGSILDSFAVWGGGSPDNITSSTDRSAHGIWIRTNFVTLRDVGVFFCSGNGFHVDTTAGSTGATAGNSNLLRFERCFAENNAQDGFHIEGNDANACAFVACSAINNGGSGFFDFSFLGNSYFMCHTEENGGADPTGSGALNGTCTYSGQTYYIVGYPDAATQATAASTTTPGTDSTIWAQTEVVNTPPTWTSGKTWRVAGPYITNPANVNAKNAFIGCYAELGQALVQSSYPSMFLGGAVSDLGFDTHGTPAVGIFATGNGAQCNQGFTCASNDGNTRLIYGSNDGTAANIITQKLPSSHDWLWQVGTNIATLGMGSHALFLQLDNSAVTETWGLADDASNFGPQHHSFAKLIVGEAGSLNDGSWLGSLATPSNLNGKTVRVGDTFFYSGRGTRPAGMGQVCTTAGTVGTSATMTEIGQPALATPFANLPSSPKVGQIAAITDSAAITLGSVASGGSPGTNALVWYNGANWTWIGQ